jgi:antitoxin component YwqK of YwqJK toxin-antitoxin module
MVLFSFFVFINWYCKPQEDLKMDALNRVILNKSDTIYQFYTIKPSDKQQQATGNYYYFWFKPDTILVTHSGFDGKLLHGEYKVFYPNKNLREQGNFKNGLKTGEWKSWHSNGEIQSVSHWRMGKRDGKLEEYDIKGDKIRTAPLNNDSLSKAQSKNRKLVKKKSTGDSTNHPVPSNAPKK